MCCLIQRLIGAYRSTIDRSTPGIAKAVTALSSEHLSVDGTLLEAWASLKSFRPKDGSYKPTGPGRNGERDFRGDKRKNDTHASTTDPDAGLSARGRARKPGWSSWARR